MIVYGESKAGANEVLSSKPSLRTEDGKFNSAVLSELTDYMADRFAFRNNFVTAWAKINSDYLMTSSEDQVVLGSNQWLYYSESLNDYRGESLSNEELETIADNIAQIQKYVTDSGADFIFTIAPNKNSLYPEYMPSYYVNQHDDSNAVKLAGYLKEKEVNYVNLFEAFKEEKVLYHTTDSHWTAEGAALGCDVLLQSVGIESSYYSGEFTENGVHKGDLHEMLYPVAAGTEPEMEYAGTLNYTTRADVNGGNAIRIETDSINGFGSLYCWRDSFGIALYPYLADSFRYAQFSRSMPYDFTKFEISDYDTVIIEIVERNIPNLLEPAVFPTEKQEIPDTVEEAKTEPETPKEDNPDFDTAYSLIGHDLSELYGEIGFPLSSEYASSCLGEGQDGELTYSGFIVYTFLKCDRTSETIMDVAYMEDLSGDEKIEIDAYVADILAETVTDDMTQEEKLKVVYDYCVQTYRYRVRSHYELGETGWETYEAYKMFSTGWGNCYNFAAAFYELAKAVGYEDAKIYSGTMAPDDTPHSWVEIEFDGVPYIFDTENEYVYRDRNMFKRGDDIRNQYCYFHA